MPRSRSRWGRKRPPVKIANKFNLEYGPDFLQFFGPYVSAVWRLPPVLESKIRESGGEISSPVPGYVLIDTGAQRTCIADTVARELGLSPTGIAKGYGAGGSYENPVYFARLEIQIQHKEVRTVIGWDQPVQAIPKLEMHPQSRELSIHGKPARLTGLLGRDILRRAKLQYNGVEGKLSVNFDRQWLKSLGSPGE